MGQSHSPLNPSWVMIAGASGALGSAMIERFLHQGSNVVAVSGPTGSKSEKSDSRLKQVSVDLSAPQAVRQMIAQLGLEGIEPEALVNCAGGFRYSEVTNTSDVDLDFLINSNFKSSFYLLRELIPVFKKRGRGRAVFISSKASMQPPAGMSAYCATKAAINALVVSAQDECKKFDININAILPTVIDTPANRKNMPQADFSSWVSVAQLSDLAAQLIGPGGNTIRGALIPAPGKV